MGCASQKKNSGVAIDRLRRPKKKFAVRQSGYRAGQKKNCGAAIRVSRLPLQKFAQGLRVAPNGWREA
jgi:hypothetical protein